MTERLYYADSYLTRFEGRVVGTADGGRKVALDRTAFYPASGGQPSDRGTINALAVVEVEEADGLIWHHLDGVLTAAQVSGEIDFARRFDHMQQHTGQHLLSAVLREMGLETISFHLGRDWSTIDLAAAALSPAQLEEAEERANAEVVRNRPVDVHYEEAESAQGLRRPSGRGGLLRIVSIEGLDRSACGGTHVAATGEIGLIVLRRTEKVRQATRLEFACGRRARLLLRAELATMRAQQLQGQQRVAELEKERRRTLAELAAYRGRELYSSTPVGPAARRIALRRLPVLDEAVRAEAKAYADCGPGLYLAVAGRAVLLAVSPESGLDARALLQPHVEKGGGSPHLAQGTLRAEDQLEALEAQLRALPELPGLR